MIILGLETSCDETAVSVVDLDAVKKGRGRTVLADLISSQIKLHQPYGGVVPELAAREHIKSLPLLLNMAVDEAGIKLSDITYIAVTRGPGLKGALLVGLCFAKALAYARKIPLLALHHIEEHLFACELGEPNSRPELPTLSLIVSGGHTCLVYSKSFRHYDVVSRTRDDAAGEAFDKIATLLGLPYPGGPALAKLAAGGDSRAFSFPIGVPKDDSSFSFSGLKTAVRRTVLDLGSRITEPEVARDLAASVQEIIVKTLVDKTSVACKKLKPKSLMLTGGVAANELLRERISELGAQLGVSVCIPQKRWCTDNAVMTASLAARIILENESVFLAWPSSEESITELGPGVKLSIDALARQPLEEVMQFNEL